MSIDEIVSSTGPTDEEKGHDSSANKTKMPSEDEKAENDVIFATTDPTVDPGKDTASAVVGRGETPQLNIRAMTPDDTMKTYVASEVGKAAAARKYHRASSCPWSNRPA